MRVQLLDPSAFTPPYDRALAAALARAGAEVELVTSRFLYGPVAEAEGYRVEESFYRRTAAAGLDAPRRRLRKAAEHLVDVAAFRARSLGGRSGVGVARSDLGRRRRMNIPARSGPAPDITHHQWFTFPAIDPWLMPRRRPQVVTAHYILPPQPSRRALLAARSAYARMDAVIAHSEQGARRLREEVGVPAERVHVIPHGVFDYLTRLEREAPLPAEFGSESEACGGVDGGPGGPAVAGDPGQRPPIVLFFGLLRPYKGIETLLEAFRDVPGAELWIAGNPRMPVEPLRVAARASASPVRFAPRFIPDAEIPSLFRAADIVVLPYLDIEQSGVLYTALAFGKPLVLSAVGGFPEVAAQTGAARLVPPADPAALAAALNDLVVDSGAREALAAAARSAASGQYSWDSIAGRTLDLYRSLLS